MLCKIATRPESAKCVVWRQVRATPTDNGGLPSHAEAAPGKETEWKQQVLELERRLETEVSDMRQTAFEEGLQQGRQEAAAEIKTSSERLAQTLQDLVQFKCKIRKEAEMEVVKLSLAIARRILYRELLTDPEAIHGLVHAALQKIQSRDIWRVRVFPGGVEAVRSCLEKMGTGSLEVAADPALKSGDLLIDTAGGELDASVDTQLLEIQRGFADRLCLR